MAKFTAIELKQGDKFTLSSTYTVLSIEEDFNNADGADLLKIKVKAKNGPFAGKYGEVLLDGKTKLDDLKRKSIVCRLWKNLTVRSGVASVAILGMLFIFGG